MSDTIPVAQLRAFVERIERIEADIKDLNGDKSEVYKELRGCGFDVKAVRAVVAKRKLDTADREERDAMFDLYWTALNGAGTEDATRVHVHEVSQSYSEAKGREFPNEAPDLSGAETAELRSLTENQEIETSGGNGPAAAGQTADEASTSSGPVINSQATPPEPADIAGEAGSSSPVSPATNSGSATPAGADGHPGEPSDDARAAEPGAEAFRIGAQSSRAVTNSDDDIPAFIKQDKPDCLKLKDGHCRLSFATSALCAECNQRRAMARALA